MQFPDIEGLRILRGAPQFSEIISSGTNAWNSSVEVKCSFRKLRGAPQFLETSSLRTDAWNFGPFWQGKTPQKPVKKVLWPHDIYKKYLLQKQWVKTAIPALSSGQSNLHQPIWGCHRQLDDQHRNPNNNDRDHLVGQLTSGVCEYFNSYNFPGKWLSGW